MQEEIDLDDEHVATTSAQDFGRYSLAVKYAPIFDVNAGTSWLRIHKLKGIWLETKSGERVDSLAIALSGDAPKEWAFGKSIAIRQFIAHSFARAADGAASISSSSFDAQRNFEEVIAQSSTMQMSDFDPALVAAARAALRRISSDKSNRQPSEQLIQDLAQHRD
jgi:hypothetical protein